MRYQQFSTLIRKLSVPNLEYYKQLRIYNSLPTSTILKRLFFQKFFQSTKLVDNGHSIYKVTSFAFTRSLINKIIMHSYLSFLTAGSTTSTLQNYVSQNSDIPSLITFYDHPKDSSKSEFKYQRNVQLYLKTINIAKKQNEKIIGLKMTSLTRPKLLKKVSDAQIQVNYLWDSFNSESITKDQLSEALQLKYNATLEEIEEFFAKILILDGEMVTKQNFKQKVQAYYFIEQEKNENSVIKKINQFERNDRLQLSNFQQRLNTVINQAVENQCKILIDSEEQEISEAMLALVQQYTSKLNKEGKIIYQTINSNQPLSELYLEQAQINNAGIRLIKGVKQRKDDVFDKLAEKALIHLGQSNGAPLLIESENDESIYKIINQIENNTKLRGNIQYYQNIFQDQVIFVQRQGFGEHLTVDLKIKVSLKFQVMRQVVFGEPRELVYWLIGVAQNQNRSIETLKKQEQLLLNELYRRTVFNS